LSLAERRGLEDLGFQQRMMQILETRQLLDRAVEFLPDDMELTERRRRSQPLTRPEISVLLAYAKLTLNDDLLASSVPDDPYLGRELTRLFPARDRGEIPRRAHASPAAARDHRDPARQFDDQPRRPDPGGADFPTRPARRRPASRPLFAAVRNSYDLIALNTEIEGLDNLVSGKLQLDLFAAVQDLLLDRIVWFLRNVDLGQGARGRDRALTMPASRRSSACSTTCSPTPPRRRTRSRRRACGRRRAGGARRAASRCCRR